MIREVVNLAFAHATQVGLHPRLRGVEFAGCRRERGAV